MTVPCRSCGAPTIRAKTVNGKTMPVDAEPVDDGNLHLEEGPKSPMPFVFVVTGCQCPREHYVSHFATCPDAGKWRR